MIKVQKCLFYNPMPQVSTHTPMEQFGHIDYEKAVWRLSFFFGFPSFLAFDGAIEIAKKFTSNILECSNVFNTLGNHHVVEKMATN